MPPIQVVAPPVMAIHECPPFTMPRLPHSRCRFAVAVICALLATAIHAQDDTDGQASKTTIGENAEPGGEPIDVPISNDEPVADLANRKLSFAFEGTPWRDVVKWLADSSELALHIGDLPTGSFTYNDAGEFSPQQAIDRVNLFLLPEGFALVRSGKLLSLINLTDRRSSIQLDAIARLVTTESLADLEPHDVVKCLFPLGELKAEDAVEELTALNLMVQPAIFPKTNQILVIDSVSKLRAVKTVLDAFEPRTLDNGTVVKGFTLQHVDAEDVLVVARPHLGLATGEMIGIDVSISADVLGKNIFVTGVEDKVLLIEGLIESIDVEENAPNATTADAVLKTYPIEGDNLQTVYDVLVTLLATRGDEVRLSADKEAEAIVALAVPAVHDEIAATVSQLQASGAAFEVIPLKNVDPYFAISLIQQMLDLPDELLDDPDTIDPDAPRIDADAGNSRLFVRAKPSEIKEIKTIVAGLEAGGVGGPKTPASNNAGFRVIPLKGEQAEQAVRTVAHFWREANPIIYYPEPSDRAKIEERVLAEESSDQPASSNLTESPNAQFLTNNINSQAPPIRCQLTSRGLLLQCDDVAALDRFEEQLRVIAGPGTTSPSPPVVYYLKYTRPEEALKMLAELFDGGEAAKEGEGGSLVNGYVSSATYYNSLIRSRDGTLSMINGTITVVADTRLNRLIVQGTETDISTIEGYLKIIDKDQSLTSIETYGTSHVIELVHTRADDVATAIREAYAGRVAKGEQQQGQVSGGQQGNRPDNNEANNDKKKTGKEGDNRSGQGGGGAIRNLEPQMTIAVHEPSNSLIVTAPEPLFKEVEALARLIDERSKQTVNVIRVPGGVQIEDIQRVLGTQPAKGSGRDSGRSEKKERQ